MHSEKMMSPFAITYRFHWCGPCLQYEDTKEETTVTSSGQVSAKRFDHHGANGRFRVIERAAAYVAPEEVEKLHSELMRLIQNHEGVARIIDDAEHEIVLSEDGLKITIDGGLHDGEKYAERIVTEFLAPIVFEWESVFH